MKDTHCLTVYSTSLFLSLPHRQERWRWRTHCLMTPPFTCRGSISDLDFLLFHTPNTAFVFTKRWIYTHSTHAQTHSTNTLLSSPFNWGHGDFEETGGERGGGGGPKRRLLTGSSPGLASWFEQNWIWDQCLSPHAFVLPSHVFLYFWTYLTKWWSANIK